MATGLIFIRAIHLGSCLVLASVFSTLLLVVIPASGRGDEQKHQLVPFYRQLQKLLVTCLLAGLVSGFLWLWFVTADMSGAGLRESLDLNSLLMVLGQTQFGRLWEIRGGIALLLTLALPLAFKQRWGNALCLSACGLLASGLLASLAWAGHGGATEGPGHFLHVIADVIHLVTAAVWPASLLPFALFLINALKSQSDSMLAIACAATRRFSSASLAAVGVLAASGTVNSYFLVGNVKALLTTDYGHLLMVKLLLFAAMICMAAVNLLRLTPRLPTDQSALRKIARNVIIELCLGALVLLLVGWLGITPPAMHCPMP